MRGIISRKEAKQQGLLRYFTGKPCSRGHICERRTTGGCIECQVINNAKYTENNKEKCQARSRQWKRDNYEKCQAKTNEWHKSNSEKMKAIRKAKYAADPERFKKYKQGNYQRHKAQIIAKNTKWIKANPEKVSAWARRWRQENKVSFTAMVREWRKKNPASVRLSKHRRRILAQDASGEYTKDDIARLLEHQLELCVGCKVDISSAYTIDHILPLSRGGGNAPDNLQLLCLSCNSSKGTKLMQEWKPDTVNVSYSTSL